MCCLTSSWTPKFNIDHEKPVFNKYQCATRVIDRFPEPTIEQLLEPDQIDHKLLDQDRLCSATNDSLGNATSSISAGGEATEVEQCPACLQSVCFDSLRFAICRVGHVWGTHNWLFLKYIIISGYLSELIDSWWTFFCLLVRSMFSDVSNPVDNQSEDLYWMREEVDG
jgi:hypothetical protein